MCDGVTAKAAKVFQVKEVRSHGGKTEGLIGLRLIRDDGKKGQRVQMMRATAQLNLNG